MGVKTQITVKTLNTLFSNYNFTSLDPTSDGVMDTTYIAHTKNKSYILKKYERDIKDKVDLDKKLLKDLKHYGLNVSVCLDEKEDWYIYEKLKGVNPKNINTLHIQALARFLASLHQYSYKKDFPHAFLDEYDPKTLLQKTKSSHYVYYKKLQILQNLKMQNDGLIHGDIFKDNTVFHQAKIGVFDFIDSGSGSFSFESGVALVGFGIKKKNNYFINLFLNTYNQHTPKKLTKKILVDQIEIASKFYALLRINEHQTTTKAKELL